MADSSQNTKLKINMGGKKQISLLPKDEERIQEEKPPIDSSRIKISGSKKGDNFSQYYPWHQLSPVRVETLATEDVTIAAPNPNVKPQKFDWISVVFQPLGALLGVVVLLVVLHLSGVGLGAGLYMLIGGLSGGLGVVWGLLRYRAQKKEGESTGAIDTEKYREYLNSIETKLKDSSENQRRALNYESPSSNECLQMDENTDRLWFRTFDNQRFMSIRLGRGNVNLSHRIIVPEKHYSEENTLIDEAQALAQKYQHVDNTPICVEFQSNTSLGVVGKREDCIKEILAIIVQATALHSYEDLKIVLVYPKEEEDTWSAIKYIPHIFDDERENRFIADNPESGHSLLKSISELVQQRLKSETGFSYKKIQHHPHYLVIVADMMALSGEDSLEKQLCYNDESVAISSIYIAPEVRFLPSKCKTITEISSNKGSLYQKDKSNIVTNYVAEGVSREEFVSFMYKLAPIRLENPTVNKGLPKSLTFFEGMKILNPEQYDVTDKWINNHPEKAMMAMLGARKGGEQFGFDIHPKRSGAHGIFVGSSGSGKSTMVRSWVLSMACMYSPERVNFVLVDFKVPGLLSGLEQLPHVVGTVSNLDIDIDRNLTALKSEINRRQSIFDKAGVVNIYNYLEKHYAGNSLANELIPFLYIVIDELNEFKMWSRDDAGNDWMVLLDKMFQTGSSLGIHILAGSQTPGPFSQVMQSNASFRWCLKTGTIEDSREVLGTSDAYHITNRGRAFIKVGSRTEEIQPMFADGPYFTADELRQMPEYEMAVVELDGTRRTFRGNYGIKDSQLEIMARHLAHEAERIGVSSPRKIWPDRLPNIVFLHDFPAPKQNTMSAVVGLVDDPANQSQYPLTVELPATGSFLVYGSSQTGKTTFLQSLVLSMLTSNDPDTVEMFIVEGIAGEFDGFEAFPQVTNIVDSFSANEVIDRVNKLLNIRRKTKNKAEDERKIVLVIDNINSVISDYRQEIINIVQFGAGNGVYLVGTATQASGSGSVLSIESLTRTGFSMWISHNKYDYRSPIHSPEVRVVPPNDIPGRGITCIGKQVVGYQTAFPFDPSMDSISNYVRDQAKKMWGTRSVLVQSSEAIEDIVSIGKELGSTECINHDFRKSPSLLIIGDDEEKRNRIINLYVSQLVKGTNVEQIVAVDYDRTALEEICDLVIVNSGSSLDQFLIDIRDTLIQRRSEKTAGITKHKPYCFLFNNIVKCLERSCEDTANRIDKNLLLNASGLSVFVIGGCSYRDFDRMYLNDEKKLENPNPKGDIVPFRRMSVGRCLLIDSNPQKLHEFFATRYSFGTTGDYYIGDGMAREVIVSFDEEK